MRPDASSYRKGFASLKRPRITERVGPTHPGGRFHVGESLRSVDVSWEPVVGSVHHVVFLYVKTFVERGISVALESSRNP